MDSFRTPDPATLFRPLSVTNYKEKVLPPVGPEDMVDASGNCPGAATPPAASAEQASTTGADSQAGGLPVMPSPIALEMSECEVVRSAGVPQKVDIGTNERGERTVTLTYLSGQRPGIYSFTAGRLKSMERAPEPPPPARPAKSKPKRKPSKQHTAVQ